MHTYQLLDSESWGKVLEMFAFSVDVSVAFSDHDGGLIGKCQNPEPIWKLTRAARPDWDTGCPFCLDPPGVCSAAADAERTRSTVMVVGMGGFAHTAAPIFLADRHMGTLFAGQVFTQYPELLLLEQVAAAYHVSGQEIWRLARLRVPVSRTTLLTYGNLLGRLGQAYLQERNATILQGDLAEANEKLRLSNQELSAKVIALDESLAEKDILLNEVHHRVNNNLTVIGSLLRMQAEAFPNPQVADALRESQFRVESMALIHAHLYDAVDWRAVNFASYAAVLAENLFRAYGIDPTRIRLQVEIGRLELGVDKAIPAGLILNELISNALKHAFPAGRKGSVFIGGSLENGQVELFVRDDGVGVDGASKAATEPRRVSLGMKIMNILCHQLKGTFEQTGNSGASGSNFRLVFPLETFSRAVTSV